MADQSIRVKLKYRKAIREGRGDNLALNAVFFAFDPDDAATKKVADGWTERWRFEKVVCVGEDTMSSCVVRDDHLQKKMDQRWAVSSQLPTMGLTTSE
jgi:hypothetical protein